MKQGMDKKIQMMMNAPIPGESLTRSPDQKMPWETPPQYVDPVDVVEFYAERIFRKKTMEPMLLSLESGIPIKTLVEALLTNGVAKGLHNMDVSLLVAPVIHEIIKTTAEDAGIEYDDGFEDDELPESEYRKVMAGKMEEEDPELQLPPEEEPESTGLISRRA